LDYDSEGKLVSYEDSNIPNYNSSGDIDPSIVDDGICKDNAVLNCSNGELSVVMNCTQTGQSCENGVCVGEPVSQPLQTQASVPDTGIFLKACDASSVVDASGQIPASLTPGLSYTVDFTTLNSLSDHSMFMRCQYKDYSQCSQWDMDPASEECKQDFGPHCTHFDASMEGYEDNCQTFNGAPVNASDAAPLIVWIVYESNSILAADGVHLLESWPLTLSAQTWTIEYKDFSGATQTKDVYLPAMSFQTLNTQMAFYVAKDGSTYYAMGASQRYSNLDADITLVNPDSAELARQAP
jgi:hypothetical protein